ncbi:MAG: peptidoglycan DD-metalloendopeptidase family protein [Acidobacteria bacterium]|nr:peptidoglycan DD-metalloendopeptidase family protein [Acidobacteriota bacterium]
MQNTILPGTPNQLPVELLVGAGNRLQGKIHAARGMAGEQQKSELEKVSREFEAIFITYMLKVMRETIEESGLTEGGPGKTIYTEMFDQEIAQCLAKRGTLGISDLLYRNLIDSVVKEDSGDKKPVSLENKTAPVVSPEKIENKHEDNAVSNHEISRMQLPVAAPVSSPFGFRQDPFTHRVKFHKGMDLAAPAGMKVVPALPGKVVSAGYEKGYGNYVFIQHSEELQTRYGHLGEIHVKTGDTVTPESSLGTVGNTGHSTGPHLHFEAIRMGTPVDPLPALRTQLASLR